VTGEPATSDRSVRIVGRYGIYQPIAAGGMATVHYGRLLGPVGFSRTVAIKRLHAQFAQDPEFVSMFLDEARLAARIRHPNVVPTLDVVAADGELFLVMEYVAGESLARLVRMVVGKSALVPTPIVVAIMCGVLRGLHAAHEATNERGEPLGIVHRDVSPQNVLVGIDGQARVLDFGVAKATGRIHTTRDGKLKGKLAYMAPEQLRGKTLDRRTDVFAASIVLWEALTGTRLFHGESEGEVLTRVLEGDVVPPSSVVSPERATPETLAALRAIDDIVLRGLARRPDDRYESARDMAVALDRAATSAKISDISEWVECLAKDVLASRAQQIADIESSSSGSHDIDSGRLSMREISETVAATIGERNSHTPSVGLAPTPSILPPEGDPTRSLAADPSSISVASPTPRVIGRASPKRLAAILGIAAVIGIGAASAIFVVTRSRSSTMGVEATQPGGPASATGGATAAASSAPPPPSTSAEPAASPSAEPARSAARVAPTQQALLPPRPSPKVTTPAPGARPEVDRTPHAVPENAPPQPSARNYNPYEHL
jgi:eukaryotic-like serine/threonine-protein kinase